MATHTNENHDREGTSREIERKLEGVASTNRWLAAAVVIQFALLAGVGGWLLGRSGSAAPSGTAIHAHCPFELPPRGKALLAGVRCAHGSFVTEAHCDDAHAMAGFVLDLLNQGLDDNQIKAALLRRYGDDKLAGRHWTSSVAEAPGTPQTQNMETAPTLPLTPPFAPPGFRVGEPGPVIEVDRWIQGADEIVVAGQRRLESYEGKVVLLDFMYKDCPPCVRALPMLSSLHSQYRQRGLRVVSLCASWGASGLESLLRRLQATHPVAVLAPGLVEQFAVKVFPTYVLLDRTGKIHWVGSAVDPPVSQISQLLSDTLPATPAATQPAQVGQAPATQEGEAPVGREGHAPTEPRVSITNVERTRRELNPSTGEDVDIRFSLSESAEVTVTILGPSRELIAVPLDRKPCPQGENTVKWDGRDVDGIVVPDEAYTFKIQAVAGEHSDLWDPLLDSGGERVIAGDLTTVDENRFSYQLPTAARVLVRAAVVDGPLVRTIVNWAPRPPGLAVEHWDGMDSDGTRRVSTIENLRIAVMAFALPEKSIITQGNIALSYGEYHRTLAGRRAHDEQYPRAKAEGAQVSPHWYIPVHQNRDPALAMSFVGTDIPADPAQPVVISKSAGPILVRVDIPDSDERAFMGNQKFELIIYVDDIRLLEVEQGHVPFNYPWDISAIEPGRHILTISVASFRNHVGTSSRWVEIVP